MRPNLYTGEQTAELHCHGSAGGCGGCSAMCWSVARVRRSREFTRRAFLNGKMDLRRPRRCAILFLHPRRREQKTSLGQLAGKLKERVLSYQDRLHGRACAGGSRSGISGRESEEEVFGRTASRVERKAPEGGFGLADTYRAGRIAKGRPSVAIAGKPNPPPSKCACGYGPGDRGGCSGAQRGDTIEQGRRYWRNQIYLTDTAGIRRYKRRIEAQGVKKIGKTR